MENSKEAFSIDYPIGYTTIDSIRSEISRSVISSFGVRWRLKPIVYYYLKFTIDELRLTIDAEIEFARKPRDDFEPIYWRIKCRDFLFGFFKRLNFEDDTQLFNTLYPRNELELYLTELKRSYLKTLLAYHFIVTVFQIAVSRRFDEVIPLNLALLIVDIIAFVGYLIDTRRYRAYLSKL